MTTVTRPLVAVSTHTWNFYHSWTLPWRWQQTSFRHTHTEHSRRNGDLRTRIRGRWRQVYVVIFTNAANRQPCVHGERRTTPEIQSPPPVYIPRGHLRRRKFPTARPVTSDHPPSLLRQTTKSSSSSPPPTSGPAAATHSFVATAETTACPSWPFHIHATRPIRGYLGHLHTYARARARTFARERALNN